MKRLFEKLAGLLPHVCLILSLMMITFVITDRYNRAMAFINNDNPDIFKRGKNSTTSTNNNINFTSFNTPVFIIFFTI